MPERMEITHNGICYRIGMQVRIINGRNGGYEVGEVVYIRRIVGRDALRGNEIRLYCDKINDGSGRYWHDIDCVEPKDQWYVGREINTPEEMNALNRAEYIKEHEEYEIFAKDKGYNDYTNEEFFVVLEIARQLFKRSQSQEVKIMMKKWIDNCPKNNLTRLSVYAGQNVQSGASFDAYIDK